MKNMGSLDRIARVAVAVVIIALYFAGILSGTLAIILLIISAVFILTSLIGTCPLYLPFGLRTNKMKEK